MAEKMLPSELVEKWHGDAHGMPLSEGAWHRGFAFAMHLAATELETALAYQQERPELEESND